MHEYKLKCRSPSQSSTQHQTGQAHLRPARIKGLRPRKAGEHLLVTYGVATGFEGRCSGILDYTIGCNKWSTVGSKIYTYNIEGSPGVL